VHVPEHRADDGPASRTSGPLDRDCGSHRPRGTLLGTGLGTWGKRAGYVAVDESRSAERETMPETTEHLYIVLSDWHEACGILQGKYRDGQAEGGAGDPSRHLSRRSGAGPSGRDYLGHA
jgi:hypothetical protein